MDYRKQTIDRLRKLPAEREALRNLPEQIRQLEMQFVAIRAARTDGDPVSGSTNRREDALLSNIAEREEREADLRWVESEVKLMERNLEALKPNERRALEVFYINDEKHAAERLSVEIGYSEPQVHRIRTAAIENLARRLYGRVQL